MVLLRKVSEILKKHYPDSSETKSQLKLRPNAKRVADLIDDPLLWLRVAYGEIAVDGFAPLKDITNVKLGSLPENKVKEITERRLEILDAAIGDLVQRHGQDFSKIDGRIEAGKRRKTIFATTLDEGRVIRSRTFNESRAEADSSGCSPQRRGVVVDMYPGEQCEGYVVTVDGEGAYKWEVYKFEVPAIKTGRVFLSLGGIVTFCVNGQNIVNSSLQMAEYFPSGLDEYFVKCFLQDLIASMPPFDLVESCDTKLENLVGQVLEASALWKGLLSEERLYQQFYRDVLSICLTCGVTSTRSATNSSSYSPEQVEFLSMFKGCSFIRHLPKMLQQDPRQGCDQETDEFKSFQQDVQITSHLLKACLPCERAYILAEALKCFIGLLSKPELGMEEEMKHLALSVLNEHASDITSHLPKQNEESSAAVNITACEEQPLPQDPLFWLRLLHESRMVERSLPVKLLGRNQLKLTEEIVEKRHQALRACKCDLGEMCRQDLSARVKQYEGQVFQTEAHLQNSPETDEGESCGPTQQGVVTDLYPATEGRLWEGYIVCPARKAQAEDRVFHFDSTTTVYQKSACDLGVHIGDVVAFKPGKAKSSLQVIKYFPGIFNEVTVSPYLTPIKRAANNLETLQIVLKYPAVWKYLLNEPSIYKKQYKVILSIYKTDDSPTTSLQKKLMGTFKGSSFIQELVPLLEEDPEQEDNEHHQKAVCQSTFFLISFIQFFHDSVQPALKRLAELLLKLKMYKELKALVIAVINSYLVPPDSEQVQDRPWRCIPTMLTKQEFEENVKMPLPSSEPDPNLPVVKECYESPEEYGRTYFNLLRMDCYGELIETVTHLKTQHTDECHDCTSYDIMFLGLASGTGHRIVYNLQYETTMPVERAGSSNESPLLREGNLVCFSIGGKFDNDLVWATVDQSQHISFPLVDSSGNLFCIQGQVQVELCSEANDQPDEEVMELLRRSENVVAVESPAYFRAYQPVLEALKTIDVSKIHFIDDLLQPSNDTKSESKIIDDSSLVSPQPLYFSEKQLDIPNKLSVRELKEALDNEEEKHKFCLDESQREAVYKALSHPLTVIQGPPGTGKTYLALKLLQLFLSLSTLPKQKPIILMAYKNCALDHVLKECVKFCSPQNIVRIGRVSEGYEDLRELTLRKRAYRKRSFFTQQFDQLYRRVKMASQEVEKRNKPCWENCLPSMTPQWLTSLLMGAPKALGLSEELKQKISNDPQKYLQLVRDHTIMGKRDKGEKSEVKRALTEAWMLWTKDTELQLTTPKFSPKQPSSYYSMPQGKFDFEQDYETVEQERHMAADDLEDESESDVVGKGDIVLSTSVLDTMNLGTEKIIDDSHVWNLTPEQRKQLIVNALSKHYSEGVEHMKECLREYNEVREEYELDGQYRCLQILKRARVVGMTTTGAAIHQELLNKLRAPVVFVEEAAEVLESNLLATLTPHVKHLVLIGDHKQLKPKVACHKLAKQHKFNTSMFERLVKNNFPYTLLMRQSRMHPRFVDLFSYHYHEQKSEAGKIMSSKHVYNYQHPFCMASPIFWWSYSDKYEEKHGPSIINQHEAEMVAALCLWLLSQRTEDERTQRIQVLTPYRAQIDVIDKALEVSVNRLPSGQLRSIVPRKEIKVSTVDEFQGHESDIIILSMVRSNRKKQIGFLKEKNRLVVGTSRQKRALYIVGNAEFLKETSTFLWKPFIQNLENAPGNAIPVKFEGKQYSCHSAAKLQTAACNPESLRQDTEDHQLLDQVEIDSPMRAPSSEANPPLSPSMSLATQPLQQQSSPADRSQRVDNFRRCLLKLQNSPALKEWKTIVRQLGVKEAQIIRIVAENQQDPAEAFYQAMLHWYNKEGKVATSQKLIDALEETQLKKVVEDFETDGYFNW